MNARPLYLDKENAAAYLALSVSTFEKLVRQKKAPEPRQLSDKRVGWLVRELETWGEARPISEQLPPHNTGLRRARIKESA